MNKYCIELKQASKQRNKRKTVRKQPSICVAIENIHINRHALKESLYSTQINSMKYIGASSKFINHNSLHHIIRFTSQTLKTCCNKLYILAMTSIRCNFLGSTSECQRHSDVDPKKLRHRRRRRGWGGALI